MDRTRFFSTRELELPGLYSDLQKELHLCTQNVSIDLMGKCRIMVDTSTPGQKFYYIFQPQIPSSMDSWRVNGGI